MFGKEDCFLLGNSFFNFTNKNLSIKYHEWSKEARRQQISVVMLLAATLYIIVSQIESNLFIMHIFWMLASFSFGFVGAYLLEKSNKDTFLTHEELLIISKTDSLTGLQNRSRLNELLREKIERFKRYSSPFAVAIIDIDFFKDNIMSIIKGADEALYKAK